MASVFGAVAGVPAAGVSAAGAAPFPATPLGEVPLNVLAAVAVAVPFAGAPAPFSDAIVVSWMPFSAFRIIVTKAFAASGSNSVPARSAI